MKDKLQVLRNTLLTIETKGESTLVMADCIKYLTKLMEEETNNETTKEEE